jgi:hypothetical protein
MSLAFIGTHIEAIYHTSVVIYGKEYYFGQGIQVSRTPGHTPYGRPLQMISMGTTGLTEREFNEYLSNLALVWTADRYHLLDNNCNHFTNEVCQFLCSKRIPEYISDLPENFAQTPLGRQLRPMLDMMFSSQAQQRDQNSYTIQPSVAPAAATTASVKKKHKHENFNWSKEYIDSRMIYIEYQHGSFVAMRAKLEEGLKQCQIDSTWVQSFLEALSSGSFENLKDFGANVLVLLETLPDQLVFAWFDLLRILFIRNTSLIDSAFASDKQKERLFRCILKNSVARECHDKGKPPAVVLTSLKLLCNILSRSKSTLCKNFTSEDLIFHSDSSTSESPLMLILKIFQSHFLETSTDYSDHYAKDSKIKQIIASIGYNLSICFGKRRFDSNEEPESYVELTSALVHHFSTVSEVLQWSTEEQEIQYRLICALWINLLYANEEIIEMAKVLGLSDGLNVLKTLEAERWKNVVSELSKMIQ